MNAAARLHAMLPPASNPIEAAASSAEMTRRINAHRAEVAAEALLGAAEAAAAIHAHCGREDCAGCRVRRDILAVLRSVANVIAEPSTAQLALGDYTEAGAR